MKKRKREKSMNRNLKETYIWNKKKKKKKERKEEEEEKKLVSITGGYDPTVRSVAGTPWQIDFRSLTNNPYSTTVSSDSINFALAATFKRSLLRAAHKRALRARTIITSPTGSLLLCTDELIPVDSPQEAATYMVKWARGQFEKVRVERKAPYEELGNPPLELDFANYKQIALGAEEVDGVTISQFAEFTPVRFQNLADNSTRGILRIDFSYFSTEPADFLQAAARLQD